MNNKMIDGMKKEGKPFLRVMIFSYIMTILMPLAIYLTHNERYTNKDILLCGIIWVIIGSFCLYGWLYAVKYRLEFNDEKVYLKTLFNKIELNISDIKNFSCKRYLKSSFYQFSLYTKNKKVLVNTRYRDEFIQILRENNIKQISWKNK